MAVDSVLHIPQQIRFQCTRCAHCCNYWPVPLTDNDVRRLESVGHDAQVMTLLPETARGGLDQFSHVLEKNRQGFCYFLEDSNCTVENSAKPSMCRLFPYSFMDCPEGVYVGLSFASSGVLANSGALLSEQAEALGESLLLFRELFPDLRDKTISGWQKTALLSGLTLPYGQVKLLVDKLAERLAAGFSNGASALDILADYFNETVAQAPSAFFKKGFDFPEVAEQAYLSGLREVYLDSRSGVLRTVSDRVITERVMEAVKNGLLESAESNRVSFEPNEKCRLLILRFVYVRVHSRMFFGPGFSSLSFLAGLGHLISLVALLHLEMGQCLKLEIIEETEQLIYLSEKLRLLDGKLTSARYGDNARSMLELLFRDKGSVDRIRKSAV